MSAVTSDLADTGIDPVSPIYDILSETEPSFDLRDLRVSWVEDLRRGTLSSDARVPGLFCLPGLPPVMTECLC